MRRWQQALLAGALLFWIAVITLVVVVDVRYSRLINARLGREVFSNASMVFSGPTPVFVGEAVPPAQIVAHLRKALYSEGDAGNSGVGSYRLSGDRLEIRPGPASFFRSASFHEGPVAVEFKNNRIASITPLDGEVNSLDTYDLEPEVITTLFDEARAKRRLVAYEDLPQVLIDAVLAAEDHRFFSHHGVSLYRIVGAAARDIRADDRAQGGSTLTMQLARDFFLTRKRTFRRKVEEMFLAILMEQRLSKKQIFTLYANQTYLGQRGSFAIYGFGEAADAYFNKDVRSLTLPEAALLAGLIRGPNLYSPYRNPKRAMARRNYVLQRMREDGFIPAPVSQQAEESPLNLAQQNIEANQAPFFVDMVRDQLLAQIPESDLVSQSFRIYTTLDLDLQQAASDGVRAGVEEVDKLVGERQRKDAPPPDPNQPQVALVALDPHSGEIRAMVGGRNYGVSQLNHALARRQPGSVFKPFVYAAALNSGVDGSQNVITPATILTDEPTTFAYEGKTYDPGNYKEEYHGSVTVREALKFSLNVATVRLAEMVGYERVRNLAIAAGMNKDLMATPALALGSYVATPLEMAGAYTVFANGGEYVAPTTILAVNDSSGRTLFQSPQVSRRVLDPRVNYLMVSLMETVINNGTGAGVRSRGFTLPAAGKTGTSHDAWFAGFTSNLLAVVWVGYDDDHPMHLSGSAVATPLWAEFMKRATALPDYHNVREFSPPEGIVSVKVPAHPEDPNDLTTRDEYFIEGTQPRTPTVLDGVSKGFAGLFHKVFGTSSPGGDSSAASSPQPRTPSLGGPAADPGSAAVARADPTQPAQPEKKPGALKKLISIFRGGHKKSDQQPPQDDKNQ